MTLTARASSDPQARHCPGSIYLSNTSVPSTVHDDDDGHPAAVGTKVHALLAEAITTRAPVDLPDDAEVKHLFFSGMSLWKELREIFPGEIQTELDLSEGTRFPGHVDVAIWDGARLAVIDWKSGRKPASPYQMIGYLGRILAKFGWQPEECYYVIGNLRENDRDIQHVTPFRIREHMDALERNLRIADAMADGHGAKDLKNYAIGGHCETCSARIVCPAVGITVRSFVAGVIGKTIHGVSDMTDAEIREVRLAWKCLEEWQKGYDQAIKKRIDQRGPIRLTEHSVLRRKEVPLKSIADARTARRYLQGIGAPAPGEEMSNSDFEEAVKAYAREKGLKIKDALTEAWDSLRKLGVVAERTSTRYEETKDERSD